MRRGFSLGRKREGGYAPYTRSNRPEREDRVLYSEFDDAPSTPEIPPPYTVKDLKDWGKSSVRLTDDACMSAKVNLEDLGAPQRLVFHNIKVGTVEISTLLDSAVLELLPSRFSPPLTPMEDAIEFRSAGGKGIGAFARCDLRAAALIHVEYPATIAQNTVVLNFGMTQSEVYRELFRRVPDATLRELLALRCSQPDGLDIEEAILRSNTLGITLPAPSIHGSVAMGHNAIFLQASQLNHSCSPNVVHRFDPQSLTLSIHTICPIAKGEEIVHSYIDLSATPTRAARRALLCDLCHFTCLCARCTLPDPKAVAQSDARREKIHAMTRAAVLAPLEAWVHAHSPAHAPADALIPKRTKLRAVKGDAAADLRSTVIPFHIAALAEMLAEGLYHHPYFLHVSVLAVCFAALEDTPKFRFWMGKARDVMVGRLMGEAAVEMLKFIVYPETFQAWGWAKRIQCGGANANIPTMTTT